MSGNWELLLGNNSNSEPCALHYAMTNLVWCLGGSVAQATLDHDKIVVVEGVHTRNHIRLVLQRMEDIPPNTRSMIASSSERSRRY